MQTSQLSQEMGLGEDMEQTRRLKIPQDLITESEGTA
jgi:hypothetical protein